jgi:diadenosine tetraphosphate (Ap4A) HIT family hydrolase
VTEPCPECQALAGGTLPQHRKGPFVVHARLEPGPVPGWMVVAPRRHVEQIDDLSAAEQALFGPLLAEVAQALRAETPAAKVYVSAFGEVLPHFHVHVIARPPGLPAEEHGAALFAAMPPVAASEADAVSKRVLARLGRGELAGRPSGSVVSPAVRAALLSGLVCPGAGQLRNGQRVKGWALIAATLAAAGFILWKLLALVSASMPSDATLDPVDAMDLATRLAQQASSQLSWVTTVLLVLWIYGIVDAWLCARPSPGPPASPRPQR